MCYSNLLLTTLSRCSYITPTDWPKRKNYGGYLASLCKRCFNSIILVVVTHVDWINSKRLTIKEVFI